MKIQLTILFTLILCLQTNLYSMHPTRGQLTIPQTKDEEAAHALAIADIKKQQEKQIEQLETKKTVATQQAELNPVIFKNLPTDLQPHVFQFMQMSAECSAALLEHRKLKIEHDNIAAFIQMNQNQVATASLDGTLKIWDITTGKQVLALPQEDCSVQSLVKVNNTTIAFGLENGSIKLWDIATNELISCLSIGSGIEPAIISLLKFSDRYIISAARNRVIALDITDLKKPRCINLPGEFDTWASLSKISDTCISFGTSSDHMLILDLSDIENPVQKFTFYQNRRATSCITISPSCIAYGTRLHSATHLIDLATHTTHMIDYLPFKGAFGSQVSALSAKSFITYHGSSIRPYGGLKIWSMAGTENPACIATISNDHACNLTIKLSDTSFACVVHNAIHVYAPSAEALEAYYELSLTDKLRVSTLIKMLNKRANIQFPPTHQIILNDTELALFKKLPAAIKKVLMKNFGISYTENTDAGDHKE